jgi:hypothetical protein
MACNPLSYRPTAKRLLASALGASCAALMVAPPTPSSLVQSQGRLEAVERSLRNKSSIYLLTLAAADGTHRTYELSADFVDKGGRLAAISGQQVSIDVSRSGDVYGVRLRDEWIVEPARSMARKWQGVMLLLGLAALFGLCGLGLSIANKDQRAQAEAP